MNHQLTEEESLAKLIVFYQERIELLQNIKLEDLLRHNPYLTMLVWEGNAALIVRKLLDNYCFTRQSWWKKFSRSPQFTTFVSLLQRNNLEAGARYQSEMAGAENRLAKAMIETYCTSDYGIDWGRLLRENQTD